MEKFAILQSGFVTGDLDRIEKSEDTSLDFRSLILNKAYYKDDSKYFYYPIVNNLYKQYNENNNLLSNFNFKENIIKVAYQIFGNISFLQWLELQKNYALVTNLHKTFINETLQYIYLDKDRYTSVSQWINLLNVPINKNDVNLLSCISEERQSNGSIIYFYINNLNDKYDITYQINKDFTNTLSQWLAKTDGYLDLLFTMYAIFGDKVSIKII